MAAVEATSMEIEAAAGRNPSDLRAEQDRIKSVERAEGRQELKAFQTALRNALTQTQANPREAAYDSAVPEQNEMADVLIHYLVRAGYAEVRTEQLDARRHVYYIRIDWVGLRALAEQEGCRPIL